MTKASIELVIGLAVTILGMQVGANNEGLWYIWLTLIIVGATILWKPVLFIFFKNIIEEDDDCEFEKYMNEDEEYF